MWMFDDDRFLRGMIFLILVVGGFFLAFHALDLSEKRALAEAQANPCPTREVGQGVAASMKRAMETCPSKKTDQGSE